MPNTRSPSKRIDRAGAARPASDPLRTIVEQNLRLLVDSIPGMVATTNSSGELEFVNRQVLEYFGRPLEELQAWELTDAVHPDDRERVIEGWRVGLASEQPHTLEHRLRRADGTYHWFQYRNVPVRDLDGRLIRWYGLMVEIDDLRQATDASRATEQSLRLLIDSVPGLVFTTKPTGELEFVNRQLLDYFGKSVAQLQAWAQDDSIHPDDLPNTIAVWGRAIERGQPVEVDQRMRRADGVYRWFTFRAAPLFDDQGRVSRWYGLVADIDDVKRAEQASRAGERELRLLIDNIPAYLYTMTPSCEIELVNNQVVKFFGKPFEELKQWAHNGCVHPDDVPRVRASLARTIEFGEPHELEQRLRRWDGVYRWFKPRGLPLRGVDGKIERWYCILTDIDDLRSAEDALRSTQTRLARAMHLATVSELSASIAHEVNQPLTAVVANAHACHRWLSAQPANIERALLSAERTARDGTAAAQVIQRIRLLFQRAPPAKSALSLNETIEEVCSLIAGELRANDVALVLNLQRDLPQIAADRLQMQQVILNLVRNGLEAAAEVAEHRQLSIRSQCEGSEVVVQVMDTGNGIRDPSNIFEPFYTTKAQGMGMGLAICRSIIEAHGGRLWATANEPHGAVFSFALQSMSRPAP